MGILELSRIKNKRQRGQLKKEKKRLYIYIYSIA